MEVSEISQNQREEIEKQITEAGSLRLANILHHPEN
jgi:hypothetical protein